MWRPVQRSGSLAHTGHRTSSPVFRARLGRVRSYWVVSGVPTNDMLRRAYPRRRVLLTRVETFESPSVRARVISPSAPLSPLSHRYAGIDARAAHGRRRPVPRPGQAPACGSLRELLRLKARRPSEQQAPRTISSPVSRRSELLYRAWSQRSPSAPAATCACPSRAAPGITCRTPPRGFWTAPRRRGIKWTWQWKILWPAASPALMPM